MLWDEIPDAHGYYEYLAAYVAVGFHVFFSKLEGLLIHTEEEEEKWISNLHF